MGKTSILLPYPFPSVHWKLLAVCHPLAWPRFGRMRSLPLTSPNALQSVPEEVQVSRVTSCACVSVGSLDLPCSSLQRSRDLEALIQYLALPWKLGCCFTPVCARKFYCEHSLPVVMNVIKWRRYEGQISILDSWLTIVCLCIASPVEPLWFSALQIKKCIFCLCVFGLTYILPVGIKYIC